MSEKYFHTDLLAQITVPFSPTKWGERVVYVQKRADKEQRRYKTALFAVPIAGGASVRLTMGEWADRQPMATPDALLFVSNRERGDQIWRLDASGGEARRVTSFGHGSIGASVVSADGGNVVLVWTPGTAPGTPPPLVTERSAHPAGAEGARSFEGARTGEPEWKDADAIPVARVFNRPHTRTDGAGWEGGGLGHLWLVEVATGSARRLTEGPYQFGPPTLSPDGRTVVAPRATVPECDRDLTRNDLVAVDIPTGAVRMLAKPDGLADVPQFSPDGTEVAFVLSVGGDWWGARNPRLALLNVAANHAEIVCPNVDRPVGDWGLDDLSGQAFLPWPPVFWRDGMVIACTDRAASRLIQMRRDGSHTWLTPGTDGCSSAVNLGNGRLGGLHGSPDQFVEVARLDAGIVRLTDDNGAVAAVAKPRRPERVEIVSDGVTVQGWYLSARNSSGPAPALLYVHGGPHTAYGTRLFFEMQWHADQGYAVMWTNPRGSHSFGEAFCGCIDPHWGDPDGRDQIAFVDWLANRPEVDGTRVGITGGSYGGFMSLYMAATTKRFACAAADRGLYDWAIDASSGDFGHAMPELFNLPYPWDNPNPIHEYSLLRIAMGVTCPFLVLHGEQDLRCDKAQALALHDVLLRQGVPTALLLFPEEDHGMTRGGRIDRRAERLRQLNAWFEKHLRGGPGVPLG